jgi:RimJ/RimL family protein N-acetyltransferase
MSADLLVGDLVRLTAEEPKEMAKAFYRWNLDTEYFHLLDSEPARLVSEKKWVEWLENDLDKDEPTSAMFAIRTKADDELIGFTGLFQITLNQGDGMMVIAIGKRSYWGKGYGTDALRILQRYAFYELNLNRMSLWVFDYNLRARKAYEKAGFIVEGRIREMMLRDGRRWDWLMMGILREEWMCREVLSS